MSNDWRVELRSSSRSTAGAGLTRRNRRPAPLSVRWAVSRRHKAGRVAERHLGQLDLDIAQPCLQCTIQRVAQQVERPQVKLAGGVDPDRVARPAGAGQDL